MRPLLGIFIALFSLTGCGAYEPEHCRYRWFYEEAPACFVELSSSRIFLRPKVPGGALQLELVRDACGYSMYLSTICYVLTSVPVTETVAVAITDANETKQFCAELFEGRQRCKLPEEARDMIINALHNCDCVEIKVGIHTMDVTFVGFGQAYNCL